MENIQQYELENIISSDINFITHLSEYGPKLFELCNENVIFTKYKDNIICYEKLYISNEIVDDGFNKFIEYISKDKTNMLFKYFDNVDVDDIKYFINKFQNVINIFDTITILNLTKNILSHNKALLALNDGQFWSGLNGKELQNTFLGKLVDKIDVKLWSNLYMSITDILYSILGDDYIRSLFISWIANIFNFNINKINLDTMDPNMDNYSTDIFLAKVVGMLISLWEKCINKDMVKEINAEYIIDTKCPIRWYQKKKLKNNTYIFSTQCFFLILNGIRVAYIPIINRLKTWVNIKKELEKAKIMLQYGLMVSEYSLLQIYKELNIVTKVLYDGYEIIKNQIVNETSLIKFYDFVIYWIQNVMPEKFQINSILWNMSYFIKFLQKSSKENSLKSISKDVVNLSLEILRDNKYTNSIDIRFEFVKILNNTWDYLIEEDNSNFIFDEYFVISYIDGLINFHNYVDQYNISAISEMAKKGLVYDILIKLYDTNNNESKDTDYNIYNDLIKVALISDKDRSIKFVNIIINDAMTLNDIFDSINEKFKKTSKLSSNHKKFAIAMYDIFYNYVETIKLLRIISSLNNEILLDDVIFPTMSRLLNISLKRLYDLNYSINFVDNNYEVNIDEYICNLLTIFNNISKVREDSYEIIKSDEFFYSIDNYENLKTYIDSSENFFDEMKDFMSEIIENLKNYKVVDEYKSDIPIEFLDPLTYIPIKTPILLPNMGNINETDLFMEKSVILKYLLMKEENPFTGNQLTKNDIDSYNNSIDIKHKIEDFKHRFTKWKEENLINK